MRGLYQKFFHIPKHEKIREDVMLARVIIATVTMLVCLAAMSLTTYAYFSYSITSGSNIIKAANFEVVVSIEKNVGDNSEEVVIKESENDKTFVADLEKGIYTVTLKKSDNSTATTGFCIVTAEGCPNTFHTQQLGADENADKGATDKITFEIEVNGATTIKFISHWGTSSQYDHEDNQFYITSDNVCEKRVVMKIHGNEESDDEPEVEMETSSIEATPTPVETTPVPEKNAIETPESAKPTGTPSVEATPKPAETTPTQESTVTETPESAEPEETPSVEATPKPAETTPTPEATVTESPESDNPTETSVPETATPTDGADTTTEPQAETENPQVIDEP